MRQYWLAKKAKKKVALFPEPTPNPSQEGNCTANVPVYEDGSSETHEVHAQARTHAVHFKIVGTGYEPMPEGFDPSQGTISKAIAVCPVCGAVVEAKTTRKLFQEGKAGQRMVAVVLHKPGTRGKRYRIATEADVEVFKEAEQYLEKKRENLMMEWGIDPVPDEPIESKRPSPNARGLSAVTRYAFNKWGDLFNSRHKLALITFVERVRQAYYMILERGDEKEYAKSVVSYLGLGVDRLSNRTSQQNVWNVFAEKAEQVFLRQAIPMLWDYCEINTIENQGWGKQFYYLIASIKNLFLIDKPGIIAQFSATSLPYPNNYFDAIFTDPPYYDNVPYSYLSDFFYVWLKRSIGNLYPEVFSTPLTPKKHEIVAYSIGHDGFEEGKKFFEEELKKAFQEIFRILKPKGIATIVYAHKSIEGWETLINSLLNSGLVMTGAWPLRTEMAGRVNANETASLASSIYIVCRKMERQAIGFYNEVKEELKQHLHRKLHRLWEEGIGGADFFIAAIGSAIEVFGKYEKVMDFSGTLITTQQLLSDVREIAADYAFRQILPDGVVGNVSDFTRFYVLWRRSYGEVKVHFDEARKLAQSCHIDLTQIWGKKGCVRKTKEFIQLLGPQQRKPEDLQDTTELIDVLHHALLLYKQDKRQEMYQLLALTGYGKSGVFYRVAQAINETLPLDSDERKLLEGFLIRKDSLPGEIEQVAQQTMEF